MTGHAAPDGEGIPIAALEQIVDAVIAVDETGRIVFFNMAAERLWGCERVGIVGATIAEQLPELAAHLAALRAGEKVEDQIELRIARRDGSDAVASVSLSRVTTGGRSVLMAFARNITAEVRVREEHHLLLLAANESDRVVMIVDARYRVVYVNQAFTEMFGHMRGEVTGRSVAEVFGLRNAPSRMLRRLHRRAAASLSLREELMVKDKAGRMIWIQVSITPVRDPHGAVRHRMIAISNITEAKQLQVLQRDVVEAVANGLPLKSVMRLICERVEAVAPDTLCSIISVDAERKLHLLAAPGLPEPLNSAVEGLTVGIFGCCPTAVQRGEPVFASDIETDPLWEGYRELVLPYGLKACWSSPIKLKDGRIAGTFALYFREKRRPSVWHEHLLSICLHLTMLAIERDEAKAHIARLAHFDVLTGLPNRTHLRDMIRERIRTSDPDCQVAFLFLDIDRFKDVNDTLGHAVGDQMLVEAARRLSKLVGPQDILGRYGGDEFVVVLGDCDTTRAAVLAGRVIEQLLTPMVVENMPLPVSVSIGICVCPADGEDEATLLKHADTAMYDAKSAGGGTFRFFRPEMNIAAQERLVLTAALREAIARSQLRLHYQPQVDCQTGEVRGAEALARWTHPIFGEVSPGRFIPLAEECGLIEAIGSWALEEACGQLAAWRREQMMVPGVSVNLSAVHFRNPGLTSLIAETLDRHGLRPGLLTVEITEGVVMDDDPITLETARAIHDLGVRLSLDDFGTGYSSLSYLGRLPIDELKIDRGFMQDLENDRNAQAVATAVVKIGQSLGLSVVAEGVETLAQRRFLAALDCDMAQGFLISRPLAPDSFARWYAGYDPDRRIVSLSGAA